MIRVVITHPDGRIGARTVVSRGYITHAIAVILENFGEPPPSFHLKVLDVEPDELPAEAVVERDAGRIARRLITNVGRKLIERGFE